LINELQSFICLAGGQAQKEGGLAGTLHRGFALFTSFFRDDEQSALNALQEGESFLARK